MNTIKRWLIIVLALVLPMLVLPCACVSGGQNSITIISPIENVLLRNNITKVEGTVSRNASNVAVNGQAAYVSGCKFFAYVELSEGLSTIVATATVNKTMFSNSFNVSFTPPLAVFIYGFRNVIRLPNSDVTIEITGAVSKPEATVTLNGEPVTVAPDGQFSKEITVSLSIRSLIAGATLGDDHDTYEMAVFNSGGFLGNPPFGGSAPDFPVIDIPRTATVNRGSDVILEWTYQPKQSIRSPKVFNLFASGAPSIVPTPTSPPLPQGMTVTFFPESFTAYANCVYTLSIVISASKEVKPGIYEIQAHLPNMGPSIFIEVR